MATYKPGTRLWVCSRVWERVDADERCDANAVIELQQVHVSELEWVPPHQRLQVRMVDAAGRELALTRHELEMNGARHG